MNDLGVSKEDHNIWIANWIQQGFEAYETFLADAATGRFSHGDTPTMADVCLIPQIANARLNKVDLSGFPRILEIDAVAGEHDAFIRALPANQPDAE